MVEELSPPGTKKEEAPLFFSLRAIGKSLFGEKWRRIERIGKLTPPPLDDIPLMIIKANKDLPSQGCFLESSTQRLEEVNRVDGDSVSHLFDNLCKESGCSPEAVGGVVVFLMPGVKLKEIVADLEGVVKSLSPGIWLWFIEPFSFTKSEREVRQGENLLALKNLNLLTEIRSIEKPIGLFFSTGRLKKTRKRIKEPKPVQPEPVLK